MSLNNPDLLRSQVFINPDLFRSQAFINGEWCEADDNKRFIVRNPATQEEIAQVSDMSASETYEAVLAAQKAWPAWKKLTGKARGVILRRWYQLILDHQEDLAQIISLEQGKPLTESRGEVLYGASFVEWFSEEAKRVYGDVIPGHGEDKRIVVLKQPIGIVAAITPWNFPIAMITRKCAPALATGCPVIVKPAPETPLTALAIARLAELAGIPAGIYNVLPSTRTVEVGNELTQNPLIRKLSFTGSTAVGKLLMQQCASSVKRVSLELGGNAPFIVFDDADIDAAVEGAMISKFRNTGQTCVCANRILVQSGVHDIFVSKLKARVEQMVVGHAFSGDTQQGPMITDNAYRKVTEHVDDAVSKGAQVITGGAPHSLGGNFYQPTILTGASKKMRLADEETFGPVAPIFKFDTEEEALELSNNSESGLAGYFYSNDLKRVWRVAEALEVGMVGINEGLISTEVAPFGGIKMSGIGREGSKYGCDDFLEIKYLCYGGI